MCQSQEILSSYRKYLEGLAASSSSERFSNGGKEYAPILMSVLFDNTQSIARVYAKGFRPELITKPVYWSSLQKFLSKYKTIQVLVETADYRNESPIQAVKAASEQNPNIGVRLITDEDKRVFEETLGGHANFAVFDTNKFRMEYDPEDFKAFGSFNDPETSGKLITLFDNAYNNGENVLEMT